MCYSSCLRRSIGCAHCFVNVTYACFLCVILRVVFFRRRFSFFGGFVGHGRLMVSPSVALAFLVGFLLLLASMFLLSVVFVGAVFFFSCFFRCVCCFHLWPTMTSFPCINLVLAFSSCFPIAFLCFWCDSFVWLFVSVFPAVQFPYFVSFSGVGFARLRVVLRLWLFCFRVYFPYFRICLSWGSLSF